MIDSSLSELGERVDGGPYPRPRAAAAEAGLARADAGALDPRDDLVAQRDEDAAVLAVLGRREAQALLDVGQSLVRPVRVELRLGPGVEGLVRVRPDLQGLVGQLDRLVAFL